MGATLEAARSRVDKTTRRRGAEGASLKIRMLSPDVVSGDCSHERVERSINHRDVSTRIYLVSSHAETQDYVDAAKIQVN
jgi:hypothetical protein